MPGRKARVESPARFRAAVRNAVAAIVLIAATVEPLGALTFDVTGSWSLTVDSADLAGVTGSDFVSTHTSAVDEVVIDVTEALDQYEQWYVDVHMTVTNWPGELHLEVVRVSDGSGSGTISGGTSLQELDGTATLFFEGAGDRTSVFVQIVLTGMTVTVDADLFTAQIVFTLRDSL